jgi:hypothetical protein
MLSRKEMDFFSKQKCDRCKKELGTRQMSWFTNDTLCDKCIDTEQAYKERMRKAGMPPEKYEGCGYVPAIPKTKKEVKKIGHTR